MSQDQRPELGTGDGSYPPQSGSQYIHQRKSMTSGPGAGTHQFMLRGQMPNQMYGHPIPQHHIYMSSSQHPPGPPVLPAGKTPIPQNPQVYNSSSQHSPGPVISESNSSQETSPEDPCGDYSNPTGVSRPTPSPVSSTGSRSSTPASISGVQAGSPMPTRPPSGQADGGQSRLTMATQGYNQQMMPPPNNMGYAPTPGKLGGGQTPGMHPLYNSQYPHGNYGRQQPPNTATINGPPTSGAMQGYPGSQPSVYSNGPSQQPGAPMYGGMSSVVRGMDQQGFAQSQGPYTQNATSMMSSHYSGYNSNMGPISGHHGMQQTPEGSSSMPPGQPTGPVAPNINAHQGGLPHYQHSSSNKMPQMPHAAIQTPTNSGVLQMSHNRGSMSPSRGMLVQSAGSPLAHNLSNPQNLGSPSLNSMSNAVEQLARSSSGSTSSLSVGNMSSPSSSPALKSSHIPAAMSSYTSTNIVNNNDNTSQLSHLLSTGNESSSRPNSATVRHTDIPSNESTMGSESLGTAPSDSASVDSGFNSLDQGDRIDFVGPQSGPSPHLSCQQSNGDTTVENSSSPDHPYHPPQHHPHYIQQHYMGPDLKMPYSGGLLPPSAISSMPSSSSSVVTTANTGPLLTSVTQSISSPVTSVSTSAPPNHLHSHPHHMGPHAEPSHMSHRMDTGPPRMMPNGMPHGGMMNPGQLTGPNQVPHNMGGGGPMQGMMPLNMGGMNQNGPLMGALMGHNGPVMPGLPGMNSIGSGASMPPMGQMPTQQQTNKKSKSSKSSNKKASDGPPEKKKKLKESEEPASPGGALKSSPGDLSKLFELGPEPDRQHFLERIFAFLEESGQPVTALPVISKTPLDLYKLYFSVQEKGGFEEVTRCKKWRDVCPAVNIGPSASAAFTLKKNYIRYFLNYECKFDRGGIDPAPILAQMEAQLQHKREQKNKRAPSPAGSNSNESLRPPSTPNSQMESSYQPPNMAPPYLHNTDGSLSNLPGGGMIRSNNIGVPYGGINGMVTGPQSLMGGPGMNMMHGQQGMMTSNSGTGSMMSSLLSSGPPSYGGPMMQQQTAGFMPQPLPSGSHLSSHGSVSAGAGGAMVASSNLTAHEPFAGESGFMQQHGGPHQPTPPPQSASAANPTTNAGIQQSGSVPIFNQPITSTLGHLGPDQMMNGVPPNSTIPDRQKLEQCDRFDQGSPNIVMKPHGPTHTMASSQLPQQLEDNGSLHPHFPGPHQPVAPRPPYGGDIPVQYPQQGPNYQGQVGYPVPQHPNYQHSSSGPRPPGPGGIYGTPTKRFPDDHAAPSQYSDWSNSAAGNQGNYTPAPADRQAPSPDDRVLGGQWSPMQKSHMAQNGSGYGSPAPPSTPPIGQYGRQMGHLNSPQNREAGHLQGHQRMPPSYGGAVAAGLVKKELSFPVDSVEGTRMSTAKRKKLTNKDLAPFEPWRLMLALKSGLLAETTWALDTLNILLYDDTTYGYFGLNKLPGLLEVLTEHFRHCLMQMFTGFEDLEQGLLRKHKPWNDRVKFKSESVVESEFPTGTESKEALERKEKPSLFLSSDSNYTMFSRKGVPVKIDENPADCSVLDAKEWDVYSNFNCRTDHWLSGCGDLTNHILTHLESGSTNKFLSGRFRRRKTREVDGRCQRICDTACSLGENGVTDIYFPNSQNCLFDKNAVKQEMCEVSASLNCEHSGNGTLVSTESQLHEPLRNNPDSTLNHSRMCNGDRVLEEGKSQLNVTKSGNSEESSSRHQEKIKQSKTKLDKSKKVHNYSDGLTLTENVKLVNSIELLKKTVGIDGESAEFKLENILYKPMTNGDFEGKKLSSVVNHVNCGSAFSHLSEVKLCKGDNAENCGNISPPVLRVESLDDEDGVVSEAVAGPVNSSMNSSSVGVSMDADISAVEVENAPGTRESQGKILEENNTTEVRNQKDTDDQALYNTLNVSLNLNESSMSDELSASVVAEILREDEHLEEEAFKRDDPPFCLTPESKDEVGRRCVCISNIIRSLSCVPGNEIHICRHPGILTLLGRLLLLHHTHPEKQPPRKIPLEVEEEEREQSPRVSDEEHWWWGYLDQLRENALVIIANICSHLKLGNFSEQVCFPLLEGLLHWVICPASVARDPLPTLPAESVLSPQKLVLEALCKLCIHETNVDLLLATPPVKRLLELFNVLVHLLADRHQQLTREFSIVLLSLLVASESSTARAVALQHPSVSLLIDFIETAEQNALAIANHQGIEVLKVNPEMMGTSLDMLRRAALILLHMARVPDNHKMFVQQQGRLLSLVMSQILDQSVSNILSEVLFEFSMVS